MVTKNKPMKVGDRVRVPWGLDESLPGEIVEVWGKPPVHVRVQVELGDGESETLLLNPDVVEPAG